MTLAIELSRFIAPLAAAFASPRQTASLLRDLGIVAHQAHVGAIPESIEALGAAALEAIETLATLDDADVSAAERTMRALEAAGNVLAAIEALQAIAEQGTDNFAEPFDRPETWQTLGRAIPAYLLRQWLRHDHPVVRALLRLIGGLRATDEGGETIDFEAISRFVADPSTLAGVVADNPLDLWEPLRDIAASLGGLRRDAAASGLDGREILVTPSAARPPAPGFGMSIASRRPEQDWSVAVDLAPAPGGQGVQILATPSRPLDISAPLLGPWSLSASMGGGMVGLVLSPAGARAAEAGSEDSASLSIGGAPEAPWVLIGSPGATRLELTGVSFEIDASRLRQSPNVVATMRTEGLRLVLAAGDGDAFLAQVFGRGEVSADAAFAASWSSGGGIVFGGAAGFEISIPVDRSIGPVGFEFIRIALGAASDRVSSELAASLTFALGPIDLVIEDVGLAATIFAAAPSGKGAFGDLDLTIAFKPPTGLGLSLDAGVVRGGGFVSHDPDLGRYAGAAELAILNTGIAAVGVLLTRIEGSPGSWSMFMSLGARFVGVQLGFGFTLNGVGGLVGVNRGLDEEALADGVRCGALDSILFPEDPVAMAPRILADMAAVFPPAEGQFVFGPVVKLGWGTPTLIEADLGVVIQLPEPLTISLLGSLAAVLPEEDAAVVVLRVDVAGTANFTEGTLKVDAALRDSQVAGLALSGSLALRASLLDNPSFLFSFGGFHPAFKPPQGFPRIARLGIGVDTGDELRITLGGYFAVSSSTVQFGAICELWAKAAGFTAEGGTSFDALIIFKPFGFIVALRAWVSISVGQQELFGVLLAGQLQGPNRWHITGLVTFRLLGLKKSLELEARFGSAEDEEPREVIDVAGLLIAALRDPAAWSVVPVTGAGPGIVLAETDTESLRVHPAGAIEVRQRIVPLRRRIDHYGDAKVSGADEFALTDAKIGAKTVSATDVEDWFAAAQYWDMKDAERLSAPSFELMAAGLRLEGGGVSAGAARRFTCDYEVKVRDPKVRGARPPRRGVVIPARALQSRSRMAERRRRPLAATLPGAIGARRGPRLAEVLFVGVDVRTGRTPEGARPERFYAARERSAAARTLAVVPVYEQRPD